MNILIISKSVDKDRIAGENYNLSVSSYVEAKDTRERFKEGGFMDYILESLKQQNISSGLLDAVADFRRKYPVEEKLKNRVNVPMLPYFGRETFEMAAAALLQGENILLTGSKATARTFWRRRWHTCSGGRRGIFLFM